MIPDRIGTIGSTQGVNASSRPAPKNVASTASRLPLRILSASASCSERMRPGAAAAPPLLATNASPLVVAAPPSFTSAVFLIGG